MIDNGPSGPSGSFDPAALAVAHWLTARYAQLWDDRRYDDWIELFVEDATFDWRGRILRGREKIQHVIGRGNAARPPGPGTHITTNILAHRHGDDILALADFAYLGERSGRYEHLMAGRTYDVYVLTGTWKVATRAVRFLGDPPPPGFPPGLAG